VGHSKEEKAASHERILTIATRQFKARGLQGIGLRQGPCPSAAPTNHARQIQAHRHFG